MRGVRNQELTEECIRLRIEERMSLREIHEATGASKGSLSGWLKPYPLTTEEKAQRQRQRPRGMAKKNRGEESRYHRLLQGFDLTQSHKGKIAEAAVLFRALIHRFEVYGSPFDGDRVDWVVGAGSKLWRVQVKTACQGTSGLPYIPLCRGPGGRGMKRYTREDFDFLVGYDLFTDTCYVWSFTETAHLKSTVSICPEAVERWDKMRV